MDPLDLSPTVLALVAAQKAFPSEQTQLLADLQTWVDTRIGPDGLTLLDVLRDVDQDAKAGVAAYTWQATVVPTAYRNKTGWDALLKRSDVQPAAFVDPTANPDNNLVNEGTLIVSMFGKADTGTVNAMNEVLTQTKPKFEFVSQQSGTMLPLQPPTYHLIPHTTYVCYPLTGYTAAPPDTFSTEEWAMFRFGYPLNVEPFEVTIVNLSPSNKKLRLYCETPQSKWESQEYVTFQRGQYQNAIWSNVSLEPFRALRLIYYPASKGVFSRAGKFVPGFLELDVEANPLRTLLPVDNT